MHWTITNMPPNSDRVWSQWKAVKSLPPRPTAFAECDELSALYAFLVERAGVRSVGLFWPFPNHTVAVWMLHPANAAEVRVVVPTSQIFLEVKRLFRHEKVQCLAPENDLRVQAPRCGRMASYYPSLSFDFFLRASRLNIPGASDSTLQEIRYLREGVFLKYWTAESAAPRCAQQERTACMDGPAEDLAAFQNFADDMRSQNPN